MLLQNHCFCITSTGVVERERMGTAFPHNKIMWERLGVPDWGVGVATPTKFCREGFNPPDFEENNLIAHIEHFLIA